MDGWQDGVVDGFMPSFVIGGTCPMPSPLSWPRLWASGEGKWQVLWTSQQHAPSLAAFRPVRPEAKSCLHESANPTHHRTEVFSAAERWCRLRVRWIGDAVAALRRTELFSKGVEAWQGVVARGELVILAQRVE